jgi:toxin-antitoxin system PIN domain toxin
LIVDANLLIYAVDERAGQHQAARRWLDGVLAGPRQVGLPWSVLLAFVRIMTHPRLTTTPMTGDEAYQRVEAWLSLPTVWTPLPPPNHGAILGDLIREHQLSGNLIPDAHLAALAVGHGIGIYSTDTDFARFPMLIWVNPLAPER